ncbi:hypothetical protein DMUE_2167 [Dictyocoela muelleri]|nr:hypothetical protein DMUE_2167 [Dictyocoela muelleri]
MSKRAYMWKLLIEEFDYKLKHIEEKRNTDADLLSRYLLKLTPLNHYKRYLIKLPPIKYTMENENNEPTRIKIITENEHEVSRFLEQIHEDLIHLGIVVMEKPSEDI